MFDYFKKKNHASSMCIIIMSIHQTHVKKLYMFILHSHRYMSPSMCQNVCNRALETKPVRLILADEFIIMEIHQVPKKSTITNLFLFLAANIMNKIVIGMMVIICSA